MKIKSHKICQTERITVSYLNIFHKFSLPQMHFQFYVSFKVQIYDHIVMNLFPRNLEANFARYQDGKYLFDKSNTLLTRRLLTIDEMSVEVKRGYKRTTSSSSPVQCSDEKAAARMRLLNLLPFFLLAILVNALLVSLPCNRRA